ncbi:MAG: hydrolase [Candidatus Scalindua sp.]|nr:hydrolase [Candidatus Scalindua sp.]
MTKLTKTQKMLNVKSSILLIVDIQEKLMPAISEQEKIISNITKLITFAEIVHLPVIYTEQHKLGPILPEIKAGLSHGELICKKEFNCFLNDSFRRQIDSSHISSLIIAGVETHICISQTALGAIENYHVHVVSDAVSSRTQENHEIGLARMYQSGIVITSIEMVMFELLRTSDSEEFKRALPLIK